MPNRFRELDALLDRVLQIVADSLCRQTESKTRRVERHYGQDAASYRLTKACASQTRSLNLGAERLRGYGRPWRTLRSEVQLPTRDVEGVELRLTTPAPAFPKNCAKNFQPFVTRRKSAWTGTLHRVEDCGDVIMVDPCRERARGRVFTRLFIYPR